MRPAGSAGRIALCANAWETWSADRRSRCKKRLKNLSRCTRSRWFQHRLHSGRSSRGVRSEERRV